MSKSEDVSLADLPEEIRLAPNALLPKRERRRQLANELYEALVGGHCTLWDHIHVLFLSRDMTRNDLRALLRRRLPGISPPGPPARIVFPAKAGKLVTTPAGPLREDSSRGEGLHRRQSGRDPAAAHRTSAPVSAAKAWHYKPALRNGRPVRFTVMMSINLPES